MGPVTCLFAGYGHDGHCNLSGRLSGTTHSAEAVQVECGLLAAASAWARRLAEVPLWLKKRPTTGWRKEWKTTWAPLGWVSHLPKIRGL
jgi:hypothetical protein